MLRRTLSQNLLRQVGADHFLSLVTDDKVSLAIEVGAGEGILTERLAARYERVLAYEVDPHMAQRLSARVGRLRNVRVDVADFLAATPPEEPFQVVGNVPFSITSAIVAWCLQAQRMTSATIIAQAEYVKKRTGAYGRWSLLTILTWPEFDWQMQGQIPRSQFRPVPRVDAGVLRLARREVSLVPAPKLAAYHRMVELGFSGLGGTLFASLGRAYPGRWVADAFRAARLDRATVVAFVTPQQWIDVFSALQPRIGSGGLAGEPVASARAGRPGRRPGGKAGRSAPRPGRGSPRPST
jgi:23S rRNA (adenine-N6)-dimethyltransferase